MGITLKLVGRKPMALLGCRWYMSIDGSGGGGGVMKEGNDGSDSGGNGDRTVKER